MEIKQQYLSSIEELYPILKRKEPFVFLGSRTSTVIPFDNLAEADLPLIVDGSKLNSDISIDDQNILSLSGPVNWQEAKSFCQSRGRTIMTSPTEELAQVLSGVATSCTGERCFGFGTLRDQVKELSYLDSEGEKHTLEAYKSLKDHAFFQDRKAAELLEKYQDSYQIYRHYKNAPFPRFERETDLMVGTEGQLGIITEGKFETAPAATVVFLFFSLPKWEEDYQIHLDIYNKVQDFRDAILSCELIDENSWSYLSQEEIPVLGRDTIFLEVKEAELERVYAELISNIEGIDENDIFSMPAGKCHELRMKIPRAIFERNSQMGVVKKGTDVQAIGESFQKLLDLYRVMASNGIRYNLFGHFGDAHLHFNFMPNVDQVGDCAKILEEFYSDVLEIKGSPFAEHGIGLLKQRFIRPFLGPVQYELFNFLKNKMDPDRIFFPQGFMGLRPF